MTGKGCYGHMSLPREQLRQVLGVDTPNQESHEKVEVYRNALETASKVIDSLEKELVAEKDTSALLAKQLTDEVQEHAKTIATGQRNMAVLTEQLQEMIDLKAESDAAMSKAVIAAAELLEEVESLRSQLETASKLAWNLEVRLNNTADKLQQAEQERDEYHKLALRHAGRRKEAVDSEKEIDALLQKAQQANTAMREELGWYADNDNWIKCNGQSMAEFDRGGRAWNVLSRYPKEGGPEDETI